jgi:hypothetical protein
MSVKWGKTCAVKTLKRSPVLAENTLTVNDVLEVRELSRYLVGDLQTLVVDAIHDDVPVVVQDGLVRMCHPAFVHFS